MTVGEFALALEKVLRNFGLTLYADESPPLTQNKFSKPILRDIARESADSLELFFFPRLRDELRTHLRQSPQMLRFRGLRGCVKQLAGAQRWSSRCEKMQEQIVGYLRECLIAEPEQNACALVVEFLILNLEFAPTQLQGFESLRLVTALRIFDHLCKSVKHVVKTQFLMGKTLFEKIIAREIPAAIVYEDDLVLAIRDINPLQAPVHVLIFSEKLVPRIGEAQAGDQKLLGHICCSRPPRWRRSWI